MAPEIKVSGRTRSMCTVRKLTGVIEKCIDVPWIMFDLVNGLLNRLVACHIQMQQFDTILSFWTLALQTLKRLLTLALRAAAEKDVVWLR